MRCKVMRIEGEVSSFANVWFRKILRCFETAICSGRRDVVL